MQETPLTIEERRAIAVFGYTRMTKLMILISTLVIKGEMYSYIVTIIISCPFLTFIRYFFHLVWKLSR